jgi:Na+-translocating ferredoxin:NAD+ oxidoreductase RnfG subunit
LATSSINKSALAVAASALVFLEASGRTTEERAESLLKNAFIETSRIASASLLVNSEEKESLWNLTKLHFTDDTLQLFVASNANTILGYAILDDARGKDQPITYCIVVDTELVVREIKILAYREPYGGEVQNKSWLKQFFGKQLSNDLRPGKEIKNITGATISSRSVTQSVKKILTLLNIVKSKLPHNGSASR